jgi:hypothetical protein
MIGKKIGNEKKIPKKVKKRNGKKISEFSSKYIVVNVNKNAEKFLPEIIQEVKKRYNK